MDLSFEDEEPFGNSSKAGIFKVRFKRPRSFTFAVLKKFSAFKKIHKREGEMSMLLPTIHNNFVGCYGHFQKGDEYNILTELCAKGSVINEICRRKQKRLPWSEAFLLETCEKLFSAMHEIHKRNLIHANLKPDNLFVTENDDIKIGDLGSAKKIIDSIEQGTLKGTLYYMPPELLNAYLMRRQMTKENWKKVDVWCMGRTLIEMAALQLLRKIETPDQRSLDVFLSQTLDNKRICKPFSDMLLRMHRIIPSERPSFEELLREVRQLKLFLVSLEFSFQNLELLGQERNVSLQSQLERQQQSYDPKTTELQVIAEFSEKGTIPIKPISDEGKTITQDSNLPQAPISKKSYFFTLPCLHEAPLSFIKRHLLQGGFLDELICQICNCPVAFTYLETVNHPKIHKWIWDWMSSILNVKCPHCETSQKCTRYERLYMSLPLDCGSCQRSFCSLCRHMPHGDFCPRRRRLK